MNKGKKDEIIKGLHDFYSMDDGVFNNYNLPFKDYLKMQGKIKDEIIDELIEIEKQKDESIFLKSIKKMF